MHTDARNPGGILPAIVLLTLLFTLLAGMLALPRTCQATITINSVKLNGEDNVTVTLGATISAEVTVTTSGSGTADNWQSVAWRIATSPPGTTTCDSTPNFNNDITEQSVTITITPPATPGTYNAYFIAYNTNDCTGGSGSHSATYTLTNGVTVIDPPLVSSITLADPSPTGLSNVSWSVTFNKVVTGVDASDFSLVQAGGVSGASITTVSGSGATWTVTASTGTGSGTLGLNLIDNDSIIDSAGTPLGGPEDGNGDFTGQVYTIDKTAPQASSLNLANPDPTALASVSWTAIFSEPVTGVDSADFTLVPGGGVSGAAISGVSGSGTTWTVTASTGSGNGTLGLNLTDNNSIIDPVGNPLGGSAIGDGNFTGQVYTVDKSTCFTDNFNRGSLTSTGYWAVANEGGSFGNPRIVNNRLRLTDDSTGASTMASLLQLFPAFGNKIVVEFDHYAYDGSGADGMCVVLSDAATAPLPGAFGGSLGYAPKQASAGGDTTHPGFAGGWLGVALDEYGNFSNPTEGRTGGPGQRSDSVAVRGSGSLYTGYAYLAGTATLSPGIDNAGSTTPAPGYRYRITIDHLDGIHAWTSVERNTGAGFISLVAPFDAKFFASQAAVPTNWYLSFTGSTGAAVNIHDFDNLSVCSTQPQPLPTLDHVRILHDGGANTCAPESITLKACADATCSTLYLGSVTVNLTYIAGATWSSDPITFTGGQETVTLRKTTAGTVTLGGTITAPSATNPTAVCYIGATQNCSLTYTLTSACFDAVEVGREASTPIYTKLTATGFSLDVLRLASSVTGNVSVALVNPDAPSGNCTDFNPGLTTEQTYSFTTFSPDRYTVNFTYANAASNVRVRIRNTTTGQSVCSSDNFAIRPQQLTLSTTSALNPATNTLAAGADFNLTANAGVTSGYTTIPTTDPTKIVDHNDTPIGAGLLTGAFTAATGASATGAFQYLDVGTITLNVNAVLDSTFTAVDQVTGMVGSVNHGAYGDCTADSTANIPTVGFYGCNLGSASLGPLGRFRPHHYEVTASQGGACNAGTPSEFTYMGQPSMGVNLTVSAMATATPAPLSRYTSGYSPLAILDVTGENNGTPITPLNSRLTPDLPTLQWTNGGYSGSGVYSFDRAATPDGPYDDFKLRVTITDPDGVQISKLNGVALDPLVSTVVSPPTKIRYGLLRLVNAYGPETNPLVMPLRAEYFNGTAFAVNTLDNCTSLALATQIFLSNPATAGGAEQPGTTAMTIGAATTTADLAHAPFANGSAGLSFTAPGAGNVGYVDLRADISALSWLQYDWDNNASLDTSLRGRANFGLYRGNDRVINWRETVR